MSANGHNLVNFTKSLCGLLGASSETTKVSLNIVSASESLDDQVDRQSEINTSALFMTFSRVFTDLAIVLELRPEIIGDICDLLAMACAGQSDDLIVNPTHTDYAGYIAQIPRVYRQKTGAVLALVSAISTGKTDRAFLERAIDLGHTVQCYHDLVELREGCFSDLELGRLNFAWMCADAKNPDKTVSLYTSWKRSIGNIKAAETVGKELERISSFQVELSELRERARLACYHLANCGSPHGIAQVLDSLPIPGAKGA